MKKVKFYKNQSGLRDSSLTEEHSYLHYHSNTAEASFLLSLIKNYSSFLMAEWKIVRLGYERSGNPWSKGSYLLVRKANMLKGTVMHYSVYIWGDASHLRRKMSTLHGLGVWRTTEMPKFRSYRLQMGISILTLFLPIGVRLYSHGVVIVCRWWHRLSHSPIWWFSISTNTLIIIVTSNS